MTDTEILELVAMGDVLGEGIGGTRSLVELDDEPIFVKRVPLTELESRPDNVGSTANLFDLPMGCQYGVGSPSFGVWREVAANTMASRWVASGSCRSFPILHHWRALRLPAFDGPLPDELGHIDRLVAYWHDSPAVRRRAEAIGESTATVAMFFEYIPELLPDRLAQLLHRDELTTSSLASIYTDLLNATAFMNAAGLWHFDTHMANILTEDQSVFLADFGLVTSTAFDLTPDEVEFLHANKTHDMAYITTRFINWIVTNIGGVTDRALRDETIRSIARGTPADHLVVGPGSAIVERFATVASTINRFYERLHGQDRRTSYPTIDIETAWTSAQPKIHYE